KPLIPLIAPDHVAAPSSPRQVHDGTIRPLPEDPVDLGINVRVEPVQARHQDGSSRQEKHLALPGSSFIAQSRTRNPRASPPGSEPHPLALRSASAPPAIA